MGYGKQMEIKVRLDGNARDRMLWREVKARVEALAAKKVGWPLRPMDVSVGTFRTANGGSVVLSGDSHDLNTFAYWLDAEDLITEATLWNLSRQTIDNWRA